MGAGRPRRHRCERTRDDAHHGPISPGAYRLTFDVAAYQRDMGLNVNFFPEVRITFNVKDTEDHYHIPLLLSPFGYTTYRGA